MTAVIGITEGSTVYIGGDSAATAADDLASDVYCGDKVFRVGAYLIGFAGSWRQGQLVQFKFLPPRPKKDMMRVMVSEFVPALQATFEEARISSDDDACQLIVGCKGRLFTINSDYSVSESSHDYVAIGSAGQIALGSLASTDGEPRDRIKRAMTAAERHNAGVRAPFFIEEMRK